MSKGTWVQDAVKDTIALIDIEAENAGKKLSGPEVLNELQRRLRMDGKEEYAEISLRSVQQTRKEQRDSPARRPDIDKRWSLGTLNAYPIPPDTLPAVFKIHRIFVEEERGGVSIRVAQWISRLSYLEPDIEKLGAMAICYAIYEAVHERRPKVQEVQREVFKAVKRRFSPGVDSRLDSLDKVERERIQKDVLQSLLDKTDRQTFDTSQEDRRLMDDLTRRETWDERPHSQKG